MSDPKIDPKDNPAFRKVVDYFLRTPPQPKKSKEASSKPPKPGRAKKGSNLAKDNPAS